MGVIILADMNKVAKFLEKKGMHILVPGAGAVVAADLQNGSVDDKLIAALSTASGAAIADATAQEYLLQHVKPALQTAADKADAIEKHVQKQLSPVLKKTPGKGRAIWKFLTTPLTKDNLKRALSPTPGAPVKTKLMSTVATLLAGGIGGGVGFLSGKGLNELKDKF